MENDIFKASCPDYRTKVKPIKANQDKYPIKAM